MSRIQYDSLHSGKLLRRTLVGYLSHAIEEFPVDPQTISEMVVVGNSTMRDLCYYCAVQDPIACHPELVASVESRAARQITRFPENAAANVTFTISATVFPSPRPKTRTR